MIDQGITAEYHPEVLRKCPSYIPTASQPAEETRPANEKAIVKVKKPDYKKPTPIKTGFIRTKRTTLGPHGLRIAMEVSRMSHTDQLLEPVLEDSAELEALLQKIGN